MNNVESYIYECDYINVIVHEYECYYIYINENYPYFYFDSSLIRNE